jgi:hypothetical protein
MGCPHYYGRADECDFPSASKAGAGQSASEPGEAGRGMTQAEAFRRLAKNGPTWLVLHCGCTYKEAMHLCVEVGMFGGTVHANEAPNVKLSGERSESA